MLYICNLYNISVVQLYFSKMQKIYLKNEKKGIISKPIA